MNHETVFRQVVRGLLAIGVKPTPTKLNRFFDRMKRNKTNHINGRESRWRREELIAAGWTEPRRVYRPEYGYSVNTRWEKPS